MRDPFAPYDPLPTKLGEKVPAPGSKPAPAPAPAPAKPAGDSPVRMVLPTEPAGWAEALAFLGAVLVAAGFAL